MFEKIEVTSSSPERSASSQGNFYQSLEDQIGPGMNRRIQRLRKLSFDAKLGISIERALHGTAFYKENFGKLSIPVLRALTVA